MRSFILLCTIGYLSSLLSAQNFEVISSYPVDGAVGVTTDSITITFSEPLSVNTLDEDPTISGLYFALEPQDRVSSNSVTLSEDGLTLTFFGTLEADTDYLFYVMGANSQSGKALSTPFILSFTTADTRGAFVVKGFLDMEDVQALEYYGLAGFTAFLSHSAPQFQFIESEGDEVDQKNKLSDSFPQEKIEDNEREDVIPVYATLVDAETGEFEITGIREGSYIPLGYNLFEIVDLESNSQFGMNEFEIPITFRYDENGDLGIDAITVNATTAPNDTLFDINLTRLDVRPFLISHAFEIVEAYTTANSIENWALLGGFSQFNSHEFLYYKTTQEDHSEEPISIISGKNTLWEVYAYDSNKDSIAVMLVTPLGVEEIEIIGEGETEEPIDFSAMKALPDFIDSDAAASIMLEEGVMDYMFAMEQGLGTDDFGWDFELQLAHEYWTYTPDPTPTAPVFWKGKLYGFGFDYFTGQYFDAEYSIFIDPETGEVLYEEVTDIPNIESLSLVDFLLPDQDYNGNLDSLVFEFDAVLDVTYFDESIEIQGLEFFIEPEDSLEILGIRYDEIEDGSIVTIYVDLIPDIDYFVFLTDIRGANGEVLDQAYVMQFSTGDISDRFTISGYLETPDIDINNYFKNVVVMLIEDAPSFGFDNFDEHQKLDTKQDNHGDEEEEFVPIYAANVNPESGYFEISLIREGSYFPIAFDITDEDNDPGFGALEIPKIFYYDMNEDRVPDALDINSTVAPTDTLVNLELRALSFDRFTLSEAISLTSARFNALALGDVEFMGGSTGWNFYEFEDFEFKKGKFYMPTAHISDAQNETPVQDPFTYGFDGRNYIWEIVAYHPEKDSAIAVLVTPAGATIEGIVAEEDIEEPIEFDDMKPLPLNYIDSDSAVILFAQEGGAAFFDFLERTYESGTYSWNFEIEALHAYWEYPFDSSPTTPVAWHAYYESYAYDYMTDETFIDSLVIYLNAETGELLYHELSVDTEAESGAPTQIQLGQNYPNPFNPSTNIPFDLPQASTVTIEIFNLLGQKVATLTDEFFAAGRHTTSWNASNQSSGVYFYRLTAGDVIQTKKLMLIK